MKYLYFAVFALMKNGYQIDIALISKPANRAQDIKTFLNDPRIDGELYAYLLSLSFGDKGKTIVRKSTIPTFTALGEMLSADPQAKPITRQTIATHFRYLVERGYLRETENKEGYYVLNPDKQFIQIPLDTLQYLLNCTNSFVIKVYTYLGTCWGVNRAQYTFTIKELCQHLGIDYKKNHKRISYILDLLEKLKLIQIQIIYSKEILPYMILKNFSFECPKEEEWR